MKILIVDDHPIYAEGLKNLLSSWDYEDIWLARDGAEAVALARQTRPDVILMDISLPGMNGITATEQIKEENPGIKIVMLTSLGEEESLFRAIKAGASGYLLKTLDGEKLIQCLSNLAAGENPFAPGLGDSLLHEFQRSYAPPRGKGGCEKPGLSSRQKQVLTLLAQGNTYKQIGKALFISERTVKFHIEQAKAALGFATREELIAFAGKDGVDGG